MPAVQRESTRDGYGRALVELAGKDRNVVALDCDLGRSTRSFRITEVSPERFVDLGIAEQDMISTAAGMARMGKIVFANSFAVFVTGRSFDQIRQQVALPKSNVKICGSSAGLTEGPDGATHQSVVDVGIMRLLPNMTVIVPADPRQAVAAMYAAYSHTGPFYLRLSRYQTGDFLPEDIEFCLGKPQILKRGKDILLVSCGPVLKNVIAASELLSERGVSAGVVNFHTIKPFDCTTTAQLARDYGFIFSVEEHSINGGLGTAIAEVLAESSPKGSRASLVRLGVTDTFGESGQADELLQKHRLDGEGIARAVLETANRS